MSQKSLEDFTEYAKLCKSPTRLQTQLLLWQEYNKIHRDNNMYVLIWQRKVLHLPAIAKQCLRI